MRFPHCLSGVSQKQLERNQPASGFSFRAPPTLSLHEDLNTSLMAVGLQVCRDQCLISPVSLRQEPLLYLQAA